MAMEKRRESGRRGRRWEDVDGEGTEIPSRRSEELKRVARDKIHLWGVWEMLDLETGNRVFTIPP
jgi:hypothetical protein